MTAWCTRTIGRRPGTALESALIPEHGPAAGDWQGWDNATRRQRWCRQVADLRLRWHRAGGRTHYWKAVVTGSWDSISWNERPLVSYSRHGVHNQCSFQRSGFTSDALLGRVKVEVSRYLRGDLNCDGEVNFRDINPFVFARRSPWLQAAHPGCPPENGDINLDGTYSSFRDINPFVALLSGG